MLLNKKINELIFSFYFAWVIESLFCSFPSFHVLSQIINYLWSCNKIVQTRRLRRKRSEQRRQSSCSFFLLISPKPHHYASAPSTFTQLPKSLMFGIKLEDFRNKWASKCIYGVVQPPRELPLLSHTPNSCTRLQSTCRNLKHKEKRNVFVCACAHPERASIESVIIVK